MRAFRAVTRDAYCARMPPICGQRSKPLEPLDLDRRTIAELTRVLAERLHQVDIFGGKCECRNAEARAFLAKLRGILEAIDRGEVW